MNRREFLKSIMTLAALSSVTSIANAAGADKLSTAQKGAQVVRRRFRDTDATVPLLGFGMMRLARVTPDKPDIDYATVEKMFARAMEAGINYFDTAYMYHSGLSERCAGDLLSKYPRDSYYLADKMPVGYIRKADDVDRIFKEQLARCKVSYFDFYLVHAVNAGNWERAEQFHVYEYLKKKKDEGVIRRLGFSFHDSPEVLQRIAGLHPWDFVQIQLNYLDWDLYRSKEQYEILTKLGIPVIVMEPLRGGALASLNPEGLGVFKNANPNVSPASWAFRYVGSLPNVLCALSGMTMPEHLEDNIKTFTDFKPLSDADREVIETALAAYRKTTAVPCTACAYCQPCPAGVNIPRVFGLYNQYKVTGNAFAFKTAYDALTEDERASGCMKCEICLSKCPQKINIPVELAKIDAEMSAQPSASIWSPDSTRFA